MPDVYIHKLPPVTSLENDDKFLVVVNNSEYLITKENLNKAMSTLTTEEKGKLNALVTNGDGTRVLNNKGQYVQISSLAGYHSHTNKNNVLDKLSVNENNELTFDGNVVNTNEQYILPTATIDTLGGVKPDGTTITINENGVISGASTYNLPTASQTVLGGIKIDGDTIKINDGVISADVIGNWSAGNSYPVGYFVVYKQKFYECTVANNDAVWDESHWLLIEGGNSESGTIINDWIANTEYTVGDLVIKDNALIKCIEAHASTAEIDMTKWASLSGLKGDKGDKGEKGADGVNGIDGVSPTITITSKENGSGSTVIITDVNETNSFDIMNGIDGKSAYEVACKNGFTGSESEWLDSLQGSDGITTVTTNKIDKTCTFLATNWSGTIPYTQTVFVDGITETLNPRIDIIVSDDINTGIQEEKSFGCFTKVVTGNGTLTAYCYEQKPNIDLNIMIEVI